MGFLVSGEGYFYLATEALKTSFSGNSKGMDISALFKFRQAVLYGFIGLSAVVVDYAIFFVLHNTFQWNAIAATAASVSLATIYAFLLNAYLNFQKTDRLLIRFVSYFAVSGTGLLISILILFFFSHRSGFNPNIVKAVSIPFIVGLQYVLNVFVSFSQTFFERKASVNH